MTQPMTSQSLTARRRRREAGQSLTVAISVLFLLLFLGGIFIAIVINNLRAAKTNAKQSAAGKLAVAGLEYLDRQMTNSPEGADWRPRPNFADGPIDPADPDFDWLRPCNDPSIDPAASPPEACGYTRVNFGGDEPTVGNLGGRALVRVRYSPYRPYLGAGAQPGDLWDDRNENGTFDAGERVCRAGEDPGVVACSAPDPTRKYARLDAVGRAGVVVTGDPTTYSRSQAKSLLVARIGYKTIGINEYLRYFTNKDNRPATAALGSTLQVKDAPAGATAADPRPVGAAEVRDIPSSYYGAIRSNAPLSFYGPNYLFLDPRRNDALEVAGSISLANVASATAALPNTATGNPGRVFITNTGATGAIPPPANPNVFPSGSGSFSTLNGLVRDNVTGAATEGNLRQVSRLSVPTIDLNRYRALTLGSPPMAAKYTTANPIPAALGNDFPGSIGWGAGLYIPNRDETNPASETLAGAYSPRIDWLNPGATAYWQAGFKYVPPGVSLDLSPRFLTLSRSVNLPATASRSYSFRRPDGTRLNDSTIVRYSELPGSGAPQAGLPAPGGNEYRYGGYPADPIVGVANAFEGDYVIFAEGNLRLSGALGGRDPETGAYFRRHVTIVSNGTVYIEGNLLKDNIDPADASAGASAVRGRSTIAVMARDYVTVNTTQFLKPSDVRDNPNPATADDVWARLNATQGTFSYQFATAPVDTFDPLSGRLTGTATPTYSPTLFVRHASLQSGAAGSPSVANIFLTMNENNGGGVIQDNNLIPSYPVTRPGATAGAFLDDVLPLTPALLFPTWTYPYAAAPPAIGTVNKGKLKYDLAGSSGDYVFSRVGVAPLDIRIEALIYAQEGSFFVIPGPWFNPNPNDTYEAYLTRTHPTDGTQGARDGDNALSVSSTASIDSRYPFHGEPQDIRLTFVGAISENLPAEIGDQGAWLEKWGWAPNYQGSTGLPAMTGFPVAQPRAATVHGRLGALPGPLSNLATNSSSGIVYIYDDRLGLPYDGNGVALRADAFGRTLPASPRLPVAPGMLYSGDSPQ